MLLANMQFRAYEAAGLLLLFSAQFVWPSIREEILPVYGAWIILELVLGLIGVRQLAAFGRFKKIISKHVI